MEISDTPYQISGFIGDDGSQPRLTVDGDKAPLSALAPEDPALATYTLALRFNIDATEEGERRHVFEACDAAGNCIARDVVIQVVQPNRPSIKGKNYALLIGNNEYEHLDNLRTAVNDATTLARVLTDHYDFDKDAITLLSPR